MIKQFNALEMLWEIEVLDPTHAKIKLADSTYDGCHVYHIGQLSVDFIESLQAVDVVNNAGNFFYQR